MQVTRSVFLFIASGMVAALSIAATGQPVAATLEVQHDDPDGIIHPGQLVKFNVFISWTPWMQLAGVRFDTIATGDLGAASNISSPQIGGNPPLAIWGESRGGSVVHTDFAIVPSYFTASPNPSTFLNTGVDILRFDWIAPLPASPITIEFDLVREPIRPNARFYPFLNSPAWVEAETTWIGASVLVLPAPASLGVLALAGGLAARRKRIV